jgi:hypothetical protein
MVDKRAATRLRCSRSAAGLLFGPGLEILVCPEVRRAFSFSLVLRIWCDVNVHSGEMGPRRPTDVLRFSRTEQFSLGFAALAAVRDLVALGGAIER